MFVCRNALALRPTLFQRFDLRTYIRYSTSDQTPDSHSWICMHREIGSRVIKRIGRISREVH